MIIVCFYDNICKNRIVSCEGVIMGYGVGIAVIFVIAIGIYSGLKNKDE